MHRAVISNSACLRPPALTVHAEYTRKDGLVGIAQHTIANGRLTYYGSLELNIRQLILSDLASNIGEAKGDAPEGEGITSAIDLVTSRVETRALAAHEHQEDTPGEGGEETVQERVFMVCAYVVGIDTLNLTDEAQLSSAMQHRLCRACGQPPKLACERYGSRPR